MPEPTEKAQLTQSGPYKWVRHPMYSAVVLAAIGAAISHATLIHTITAIALVVVLILKIRLEEHFLLSAYDDYANYKSNTKALVPFIY